MKIDANIREFKRLDKEIDKSEAENEAKKWRQAELAAEATATGMSQREYARAVGQGQTTIHRYVAIWNRWGRSTTESRPTFRDAKATVDARSDEVVSDAEQQKRQRERLVPTRHGDRVEMAGKLLADPEVVKAAVPKLLAERSLSQRLVEQAVNAKNAADRKRQMEEANRRRESTAAPLPAYMARMVVKINEWSAGLVSIEPDLDALPEGRGRELVLDTLRELARQAHRCIDRLTGESDAPDDDVIEGQAV